MKHLPSAALLGTLASVAWALSNSISSGQAPPLANGLAVVALAAVALILVWAARTPAHGPRSGVEGAEEDRA